MALLDNIIFAQFPTAATTTATGVRSYTCPTCNTTETESIPQLVDVPDYVDNSDDDTGDETDEGFTVTFATDGQATVNVYYTQDYTTADETDVTSTLSRNSSTGAADSTGDGQVNFTVVPADGYAVDSVTVTEGTYKNIKGPDDTGAANTYRVTKITADTTVTITTTADSGGDAGDETNLLTFADSSAYDIPASIVGTAIASIDVSGGVSGGTSPYTFSATGLPDGISISTAGVISGTPTTAASATTATVNVTDSASTPANASIEIVVGAVSSASSDETSYEVSVTDGSGSGNYTRGTSVTIVADNAPNGKVFDRWTGTTDALTFTSGGLTSPTATFTMPGNQVNLTATYRTSQGCYVATAVYGSYDCPEVWTLRRFRDKVLARTWYGRLLIHLYYAVSPTAVRLFGKHAWFQSFWRGRLDSMVSRLQEEGFASTPYEDLNW